MEKGEARFSLERGKRLDVTQVRDVIRKAGFTPTWIVFTATGELTARAGGWAIKVAGSGQTIPLADNESLRKLQEAAGRGQPVTVTAKVPAGADEAVIETILAR
ncbi:MAG: hypothetical protein ACREJ7_10025 [Candidatus Methylomirabilales bacterium]